VYRIRKKFTFEAAHQLESAYTSACWECIHGHSYTVEMVLQSYHLNGDEMVLDFSELGFFKQAVMERWDHALILHEKKRDIYEPIIAAGHLKREKVCFLDRNPTAETMANILYFELVEYLRGLCKAGAASVSLRVEKVRVHETGTGWAEFGGER
jgi:6-pyruvoyltetrahydropterin/6-carboxytetrahydropterin synthase